MSAQSSSPVYAQANTGSGVTPPPNVSVAAVPPTVDCSKMTNVVAFDVTHLNGVADLGLFMAAITAAGFTVATWSLANGPPPACVVTYIIYGLGPGDSCLSGAPYSAAEASILATWVNAGGRLFLNSEYYGCSGTDALVSALGYTPQSVSGQVVDTNDFLVHNYWVVYTTKNFASSPVLNGVAKIVFFASGWWLPTSGAIVLTDTDGTATPSGGPVAAQFKLGEGCVLMTGDSDWVNDIIFAGATANYNWYDNSILAMNGVRFLSTCGVAPVGGTVIPPSPMTTLMALAPWLLLSVVAVGAGAYAMRKRYASPILARIR